MKKRDPKKTWRNRADRLFQEVGLLVKPRCMHCGRPAEVIHHYHEKSISNALRYECLNGVPLCNSCHCLWHSRHDPDFLHKIDEKLGVERIAYLAENRDNPVKTTLKFYQDHYARLLRIKEAIAKNL
jgi:hypothetical protein